MTLVLSLLGWLALAGADLIPGDIDRIQTRVWPQPTELSWETIPWTPAFGEGLEAANEARKPVLLWVMNGHPLGCT